MAIFLHFCFILSFFLLHEHNCLSSEKWHDDSWPTDSDAACSQSTKQKAMYGRMTFNPKLSVKPMTEMEVTVEINDLQFAPHNVNEKGGFYVAYTIGMENGPGGYFGVQMKADSGQFIFSIWDADRWNRGSPKTPKASNKLTWPMNMQRCKRNCQDCGIQSLRHLVASGLTTGTQCKMSYANMQIGGRYIVRLKQESKQQTINTKDYGGMPEAHESFGEVDRDITGSVWVVTVTDEDVVETMEIGRIMFEGDGQGMNKLGTFDEMLGCNKCNMVYHKDTRYGPTLYDQDGSIREPIKMEGRTKTHITTCKDSNIDGEKELKSITFEGGPLIEKDFPKAGQYHVIWEE